MKFRIPWPRFKKSVAGPVGLTKLHQRLFYKKGKFSWKRLGIVSLWILGGFVLLMVFLFAWFAKDLPTPTKIRALVSQGSTRLTDRNGKELYTISGEKKRILVDAKDIPTNVRQATVAIEDKRFYEHPGVDPRGIARSLFIDVFSRNYNQGGSTITQQLVKNTILSNDKKIVRKIKEGILAIEMEFLFSKDDILTMYLNQIPYGGNNYGIEAASRSFFSKSAKDLTLSEAATLASLPQAPSTYSPYGPNLDKLIARRDTTLDSMVDLGYVTKAQADEAKAVKPVFSPKKDSITAPHFVLFVKDWLVDFFTQQLGDKQLAEQKVEEGGLTVTTTLDLDKQLIAEDVVSAAKDKTLKGAGASNAGLVSIDPKTGEILSMVGSVDYNQAQFGNYNVTTALRQPGSSFKPIVYSTAFKDKYNPAYNLFDLKTDFGNYTPQNYDGNFRGPLSIRQALGSSLNIPAVKTLALVGIDKALQTASDLGITTLTDKNRYGLSLVLGGGEVKLTELTGAYGVFANGGTLVPTTPVMKIVDSQNKELYNHDQKKDSRVVLDPQIAYEITNILSDVEAKRPVFGNAVKLLSLSDRPAASKTGTTDEFRDAWTIGYTPQLVTGVWAGNNDNTSMNHAGGSVAAAPIWHDYMQKVLKAYPVEQFNRPDGIQEITVDKLSNKLPGDGSDPVKDIFASWQVPKDKDDVHVQVRVCKENGLLADSSIPDELAELRTFVNIHSEMPDNPKWEGPVQAWAQSKGLTNKPPTDKCQAGDVAPSVHITSPTSGQNISGQFSIEVSAAATSGVKSVEFLIDNTAIATDTDAPYSASYNASSLSNGQHSISVVLTSTNGSTATDSISVNVSNDTTAPGNVTSYNGNFVSSGKVSLTWVNPGDADFKSVKIYVYNSSGTVLIRTVEINAPGTSTTIASLSPAVYQFVAKSTDTSGNESSGIMISLNVPS